MEKFLIAGLKTQYHIRGELLRQRSEPYRADFCDEETDVRLNIKEDFLRMKKEKIPYLTDDEHEYMWTCEAFYNELLRHGGMMLHSSCVEKDGYAYLFSARSGTGKSTHTHFWLEKLPNTRIINDDKPALVGENGEWYAWGTPFSGKTDENINIRVPVRAIVFLHRSQENTVERMNASDAVPFLLEQTINPVDKSLALNMLTTADLVLRKVPVFSLGCNLDPQSAVTAYNEIERLIKDEG